MLKLVYFFGFDLDVTLDEVYEDKIYKGLMVFLTVSGVLVLLKLELKEAPLVLDSVFLCFK